MKAQHAPGSGLPGDARQAVRSAPDHVASTTRNLINGGTTHAIRSTQRNVNKQLSGDENRFARSQPTAPDRVTGGGKRSAGVWRKKYCEVSAAVLIAVTVPRGR